MLKKALNASKNIILLRSFWLVVVAVLLLGVALPAHAAILTWEDYIESYNSESVTCVMPRSGFLLHVLNGGTVIQEVTGGSITYNFASGQDPGFRVYPFGAKNRMQLKDIPNGTQLDFTITVSNSANAVNGALACYIQYFDGDLALIGTTTLQSYTGGIPYTWDVSHKMSFPEGAEYFQIYLNLNGWTVLDAAAAYGISCSDLRFTMDIEYLPDDSAILGSINDSLDELPDKIGDQFQDVIENEKEQSKQEGNEFVDQILDALPDPSADVLAALKTLTDATSYQGTDAVLPIPALVLPGIDGLYPSTELWAGTQFDFGEYLGLLPTALLTLVQSLFTIAIVLYCVYELKGIISYCLTLRESKGG